MRRYKIVEEKTRNGDCEYTIWWHEPFLWMKDRWVPEAQYTHPKIHTPVKFKTMYEALFYINDRYASTTKTVVAEGLA